MRESYVESYLVTKVQKIKDAVCWKWTGKKSAPDRIILLPIPEEHRAIVAKYVRLVELKAPGEEPTLQQLHMHKQLAKKGFSITVLDRPKAIDDYIQEMTS